MTQTIQLRSWALLNNVGKNLAINKEPVREDNISLLLSVFDGLNNLYEKLNKLNYIIERKIIELRIHSKFKGETK